MGLTGQVTKPGQVEPGSRGYLQHAAPGLVTQQLHLCRVQQPFLCALVPVSEPEGQRVVQTAHSNAHRLPVDCQDPGIQDDLRKFRPAALAQRPPFRGELAATRKGVQMRKNAERCEEDSRGKHPEKPTNLIWHLLKSALMSLSFFLNVSRRPSQVAESKQIWLILQKLCTCVYLNHLMMLNHNENIFSDRVFEH